MSDRARQWLTAASGAGRRWLAAARRRPWRSAAAVVAMSLLLAMVWMVMRPWLANVATYGFHDWDTETSQRYLVKRSLLRYGQFPGFNPYACGGYPAWGYVEGATNLVSPWLPAYLALPLPLALRVEVGGMALIGALGAYLFGGVFTRSHAARLLVAALWAVNGRWGLQTAAGHTWHLVYAYLPWCAWLFERARQPDARPVHRLGLGVMLALMLYAGGIYPLPHALLALGCYAIVSSVQERSVRPLWVLARAGLVALGLGAPKLLPLLHTFAADPRLIASSERLQLGALVTLLTHHQQPFYGRPAHVSPYGWHEWGMYISWPGLLLLIGAFVFVGGRRERAYKLTGLLFLLLGFGAFHRYAPWTLLHAYLPVFRSQHVPSRFLYPAVLWLAVVLAAGVGRTIERQTRRRRWLDLAGVLLVGALGLDIAGVAQQPMRSAMWMVPPTIPAGRQFHQEREPPYQYVKRDWAGPMLLSMMANTGVLNCYGVPRRPGWRWAATPARDPRYRGESYLLGPGRAEVANWSPNRVVIALRGQGAAARLVYNMHFWPGWRAEIDASDGHRRAVPVDPYRRLISVPVGGNARRVILSYRPPQLGLGVGCAVATVLLLLVGGWRRRCAAGEAGA